MNGRRLRGLLRKEFIQIFRDPSALGIAFVMPSGKTIEFALS